MAARWRVAILTAVPPVAIGYSAMVEALGHEPVAVIMPRRSAAGAVTVVEGLSAGADVTFAAAKQSLARLLRAYEIDVGLCTGFPWLVPQDALDVPRLGIVNGHPSLLPRYRGPFPIAWAVRNGETEIGMSYHFMDARFDTGNLLAQKRIGLDADETMETLIPKLEAAAQELLPQVFERLAAGDHGDPQQGDGEYQSGFEDAFAVLDTARPAEDVHRQVRAWSFMPPFAQVGPILERDGTSRRVVRTSLSEVPGAERLECADRPLWVVESVPA